MSEYEYFFDRSKQPSLEAIRVNRLLAELVPNAQGLSRDYGIASRLDDIATPFKDAWKGSQGHTMYGLPYIIEVRFDDRQLGRVTVASESVSLDEIRRVLSTPASSRSAKITPLL
ncbi:MAG: hypothetical protein AABX70_03620 [Nanoarchaeota archaeon]